MATLAQTITRICSDLSRPESELSTIVQREILSAIEHYASWRFGFNEKTLTLSLSQTQSYSFSLMTAADSAVEDVLGIDGIKVTVNSRQYPLDPWTFDQMFATDASVSTITGAPDYYAIWNKQVVVYPKPDTDYVATVTAHIKLTTLDGATYTENAWLQEGEELIRNRATAMVLSGKLDDFEKAQVYRLREQDALLALQDRTTVLVAMGRLRANS